MPFSRIISLLTDFGERDGFVGTMKGVILGIEPRATIVDISHEIERQDVDAGAFVLRNSYRYFPKGTIHVVVVDPGVGSARRVLCVQVADYLFLAPDNGVLKYIFHEHPEAPVIAVTNRRYFLPEISQTFHGRDIFSPVAAHLATGVAPAKLGDAVTDYLRGALPLFDETSEAISGEIVYVDRFGNLISNISGDRVAGKRLEVAISGRVISGLSRSYAESTPGEPLALIGSSGFLEIAVNLGDAQRSLGCSVGERLQVRFI